MSEQPPKLSNAEIIIEIESRNRNVLFIPTSDVLRGVYDRHKLYAGATSRRGFMQLDKLPGIRIAINIAASRGRIFDPIGLPEFEEIAASAARILHKCGLRESPEPIAPSKVEKDQTLTQTAVKSWIYWMRQHVDNGDAVLVSGTFPSYETIAKLPGKTLINPAETVVGAIRYLEDRPENKNVMEPMTVED
jgi:hypothetical protein